MATIQYKDSPLSYALLKTLSIEAVQAEFGEAVYHAPINITKKKHPSDIPFSQIHAGILAKESITKAAAALDINRHTLESYLGKINYEGSPLSYKRLKWIPAQQLRLAWGAEYDAPRKPVSVELKDMPFSESIWPKNTEASPPSDASEKTSASSERAIQRDYWHEFMTSDEPTIPIITGLAGQKRPRSNDLPEGNPDKRSRTLEYGRFFSSFEDSFEDSFEEATPDSPFSLADLI